MGDLMPPFGQLDAEQSLEVPASAEMPHAWIQVIRGSLSVLGETLETADGLAIEDAPEAFGIHAHANTEFLVFRLS